MRTLLSHTKIKSNVCRKGFQRSASLWRFRASHASSLQQAFRQHSQTVSTRNLTRSISLPHNQVWSSPVGVLKRSTHSSATCRNLVKPSPPLGATRVNSAAEYFQNPHNSIDLWLQQKKIQNPKNVKLFVGVSGGVDSATTLYLLKYRGFNVTGIHMQNWDPEDEKGTCSANEDLKDASDVCRHVGVPLKTVSFVKEYWNNVFTEVLNGYQAGVTPNPDLLCNKEIKFKSLLDHLYLQEPGAILATGHYARLQFNESGDVQLLKGTDAWKDQSYFLAFVQASALANTLFPLGCLYKQDVRAIAMEAGLPVHNKRDSTGLCFIGKRKFSSFLQEYIAPKEGLFYDIDSGQPIAAKHQGSHLFTIGQRSKISGNFSKTYVAKIDAQKNAVYICDGHDHPSLLTIRAEASPLHWISKTRPLKASAKYVHPSAQMHNVELAFVQKENSNFDQKENSNFDQTNFQKVCVTFDEPQRAVSPGQALVLYEGDECLGGAPITRTWTKHDFS